MNSQITEESLKKTTKNLSQDEKLILAQYLSIVNIKKQGNQQLNEVINNILSQSLGGSSQVIILELAQ